MTLLLTQIFLCLLAAALIGAVAAWFFRRNIALRREEIIHQDWKNRVRQVELDRERATQKLGAEIDGLKKAATESGHGVALADYENLAAKLEGQVAEREDAIGELRTEIQSLRGELTEARSSARQRETELLQQHERETANLMAQAETQQDQGEREIELGRQHQQELDRLTAQLTTRHEQALSEHEAAFRQQHEQQLADLNARLEQQAGHAAGERETELSRQHEQQVADLTARLTQQAGRDLSEREAELKEQHERELAALSARLEQQAGQASGEHEAELKRRYEKEISRLKTELEQKESDDSSASDARIAELAAEIELRDDTIAVLRDDLAERNEEYSIEQRGRRDEQLRSAMDESLAWQQKYEAAAAELSRLAAGGAKAANAGHPHPAPIAPASDSQRSGGYRIGSVLSHPGGPKDRLQEIKGIGPVLEKKLNDFGIYHFKQIAEFDDDDVARVSNELGRFANRIGRDDWVGQAQVLNKKYHG